MLCHLLAVRSKTVTSSMAPVVFCTWPRDLIGCPLCLCVCVCVSSPARCTQAPCCGSLIDTSRQPESPRKINSSYYTLCLHCSHRVGFPLCQPD